MNQSIAVHRMFNILGIYSCHTSTVPPGWSYHDHHHSIFEFLYCIDGNATEWVQEKDINFRSGDCILIKPGVRHSTLNSSPHPFTYLCLTLEVDDMQLRKELFSVNLVHLPEGQMNTGSVQEWFRQIYKLLQEGMNTVTKAGLYHLTTRQKLILESTLLLILNEWIQLSDKSGKGTAEDLSDIRPGVLEMAHKTAKYLENAVEQNVQIQNLAENWHISRSLLFKSFRKVYGKSPREYLTQLKLQKAKELLIHTDMSVEAVAEQLGFSSPNHFGRQFRRWTGISPGKFRPKP